MPFGELNAFALSGILNGVSSIAMAVLMFTIGSRRLHYLWGLFCISVAFWGFGGFFIGIITEPGAAELAWRMTHIGVIFIPVLFFHFVHNFLERKRYKELLFYYAIAFFFLAANFIGDFFIADMRLVFGQFYYDSPPGLLYPYFTGFFVFLTVYSHLLLWQAYRKTKRRLTRERIKYFFLAMFTSFAGGIPSFLPVFGIDIYPYTNFAVFLYPILVAYAILRYNLFDIRFVSAVILTVLLVSFPGVRLLWGDPVFIDYIFFGAVLILGIFLVRSVAREVKDRERIEELADELSEANKHLKELDKRKSEFISLASHQLRAPLTSVKGYASMLLEGSFGKVPPKMREPLERIFESSDRLVDVIEDYLTISRIEQDRLEYQFDTADLYEVVRGIVEDFRPAAEQKGLEFSFSAEPEDGSYVTQMDQEKIEQVISNIIDNAVKYTPRGAVRVHLVRDKKTDMFHIIIEDTGVGMDEKAKRKLFKKFSRAEAASHSNTKGTGLGLYIASKIIRAHQGRIRAESAGENRGSTFTIELPTGE